MLYPESWFQYFWALSETNRKSKSHSFPTPFEVFINIVDQIMVIFMNSLSFPSFPTARNLVQSFTLMSTKIHQMLAKNINIPSLQPLFIKMRWRDLLKESTIQELNSKRFFFRLCLKENHVKKYMRDLTPYFMGRISRNYVELRTLLQTDLFSVGWKKKIYMSTTNEKRKNGWVVCTRMFSFVKHFGRFFSRLNRPDLFQCLADKFTFMTERIKGIQLFLCPQLLPTIVQAFYCITKYHFEVSAVSSFNGIFVSSAKFPASWKFNFTWNYTKNNSFTRLLVANAYINFTLWTLPFYLCVCLSTETDSIPLYEFMVFAIKQKFTYRLLRVESFWNGAEFIL